jgi:hypothetical protein
MLLVFLAGVGIAGQKQLGCFGSLPVLGCGCPVVCCLLAVLFLVPSHRRCALVLDGRTIVRPGCSQVGLNTVGECLARRGLRRSRMMLCTYQLLAGGHRVPVFPLGLLQVIDARADLGETLTDLLAAGLPALWLVVHRFRMPGAGGGLSLVAACWPD